MGQSQDVGMGGSDCDCDTHSVFLTNKINEKQSPRNGLLVLKVLFSSSFSVSLLEYYFIWCTCKFSLLVFIYIFYSAVGRICPNANAVG